MNGYPKKNHNNKRAASPLSVNAKPYAPMEPRVYIPSPEPISPKTENISQSFIEDPYVSSTIKYPSNSLHLGPKSDQSSSDGSVWTARKTENFSTKSKPVPSLSNSSPSPTTSPLNVKSTSIPSPIQNVHGTSSATERSDSKKENKSQISPDKNSILSAKNEKKEPTTRSLSSVSPSNNTFVSTSYSSSSSFSLSYFSSSSSSSLTTSTKVSESENLDETSETTELEEEDEDQEEVTPSEMEEELIVEVSPKKKKPKHPKHKSTTPSTPEITETAATETVAGGIPSSKPMKGKKKKIIKKGTIRERKKIGHKKREETMERETTCHRLTTTLKSHCIIL